MRARQGAGSPLEWQSSSEKQEDLIRDTGLGEEEAGQKGDESNLFLVVGER